MTASPPPESDPSALAQHPVCVMVFNASDPSGAGGLAADISTMTSVGCHPCAVLTGAYARDTRNIFDHFSLDDEAVLEQARAVLEDVPIRLIKVGFVGSPENIGTIAALAADYAEVPLVCYLPDLSWWQESLIDSYLDAFRELLLPQTSVLVGNHSTLWRWLLPDWEGEHSPSARDIAAAAAQMGTPFTLVTGIPQPQQMVENVLASPEVVLGSGSFELFDGTFIGAGDTLSAALAALLATGSDLGEACGEALGYLDQCLENGFRPGMGHVVPDRLFWVVTDDDTTPADADSDGTDSHSVDGFVFPSHDTQH
ncbi:MULTISPECIES: bifunctional hydroxymethylpyrimidine kinase/phosphomethylpyrimidine kinase [Giesbergeria]|uniref:Hydroxymethylpyrimidine/phosphomethylpyrimidine kinase n=1 Tax=Giesbergeria sinuosa TaxID=80883 RepID=A0ABV9QG08_9BURK